MKIIDMHCDTISALYNKKKVFLETKKSHLSTLRQNNLHIDLKKNGARRLFGSKLWIIC